MSESVWMIRFRSPGRLDEYTTVVHTHNAIADYREIDPEATVREIDCDATVELIEAARKLQLDRIGVVNAKKSDCKLVAPMLDLQSVLAFNGALARIGDES